MTTKSAHQSRLILLYESGFDIRPVPFRKTVKTEYVVLFQIKEIYRVVSRNIMGPDKNPKNKIRDYDEQETKRMPDFIIHKSSKPEINKSLRILKKCNRQHHGASLKDRAVHKKNRLLVV